MTEIDSDNKIKWRTVLKLYKSLKRHQFVRPAEVIFNLVMPLRWMNRSDSSNFSWKKPQDISHSAAIYTQQEDFYIRKLSQDRKSQLVGFNLCPRHLHSPATCLPWSELVCHFIISICTYNRIALFPHHAHLQSWHLCLRVRVSWHKSEVKNVLSHPREIMNILTKFCDRSK